jgi:uncharacterized membrane protein
VGERHDLCAHQGRHRSGLAWLTNDAVNLVNTASGALIAWVAASTLA